MESDDDEPPSPPKLERIPDVDTIKYRLNSIIEEFDNSDEKVELIKEFNKLVKHLVDNEERKSFIDRFAKIKVAKIKAKTSGGFKKRKRKKRKTKRKKRKTKRNTKRNLNY